MKPPTAQHILKDPAERLSLALLLILFILISLASSGFHSFFCLTLGFCWPFSVFFEQPRPKRTYGRYSFIRLIKTAHQKLSTRFNPKHRPLVASALRTAPPTLLFALIHTLLPFSVQWFLIFLGSLSFELFYPFGKRRLLHKWIQERFLF